MDKVYQHKGIAPTVYASLTLAFASAGDAFLYAFLPVNSMHAGVNVAWIGILLSINRFVRILFNQVIVHLFSSYGLRLITIAATTFAIISTLGYGIATGIGMWMLLRICWGLSYSAMRIGCIGYALQQPHQSFLLGISKGIQEAGPMLVLFLTPVLLHYDSKTIFLMLAIMSTPAILFAYQLPKGDDRTPAAKERFIMQLPSPVNSITFLTATIIDGIIIIILGVLFLRQETTVLSASEATALAAFYLGYRRICLVLISPIGGWITDLFGVNTIFIGSLILVISGLLLILTGWTATGAIIVFTFYSIHSTITPAIISTLQSNSLSAVAENTTWRDLGAAFGTLLGGGLITSSYISTFLSIGILILTISLLVYWGTAQKTIKFFQVWK
ncbi:MAG TPA: hypothetical protein VL443_04015 [Cyclobacteriaceae bacterium]|nr:hypothetical protein [Cyclobacteriaceae bacterium]